MKRLQVYLNDDTYADLQKRAKEKSVSLSTLVKLALANEKVRQHA